MGSILDLLRRRKIFFAHRVNAGCRAAVGLLLQPVRAEKATKGPPPFGPVRPAGGLKNEIACSTTCMSARTLQEFLISSRASPRFSEGSPQKDYREVICEQRPFTNLLDNEFVGFPW
jgi:hypothetical protein